MSGRTRAKSGEPRKKEGYHPALRTCLGCKERDYKDRLARVAFSEEALVLDRKGVLPGRGGYLHLREACLREFTRRGGFVTSLRRTLGKRERAGFAEQVRGLFVGGTSVEGGTGGSA